MNLLPTFLPAILRYKGHVNNEGWEKYINATALCPVFLLYLVSVYLVSVYLSSGIDKRYLKRLVLQFCFPLVAEGTAILSLPFVCIFCEQVYGTTLLV